MLIATIVLTHSEFYVPPSALGAEKKRAVERMGREFLSESVVSLLFPSV